MDKRYHNPWDRENFAFHRTDPKPWIPFEDDRRFRLSVNKRFVKLGLLYAFLLFALPSAIRWLPL